MKYVKLLALGNLAVVAYLILLEGISTDLLPLFSLAIATSISSSTIVLGISLIIGSAGLPLLFISFSLIIVVLNITIVALSLVSLWVRKLRFFVLPLVIASPFLIHPQLFLYPFTLIGALLILFDRKIKSVEPIFFVAIPYFLTQLFFVYFYSALLYGQTVLVLNGIASKSYLLLPAVVVTFLTLFFKDALKRRPELVSISSLALAFALLLFYPQYSVIYSSSSAVVANSAPTEEDFESMILENLDKEELLKDYIEAYKGNLTELYCRLVENGNCKAAVRIPTVAPYRINYALCDIKKVAKCFENMRKVPPIDVVNFLKIVMGKDIEIAERIGELAKEVAPSPRLLQIIDEIQGLKLEKMKSEWDPKVWLGKELYGYRITEYLGKGGSSYVMVGEKDGKRYAIKIPILIPPSSATESYYDFINEYSQLKELSQLSDNIVRFVDSRIDITAIRKIIKSGDVRSYLEEPPILVMEYLEGGNAKALLSNDNVFYSDEWKTIVILIGIKVASALKEIHKAGFVHLDIKPSNILFSRPPGRTGKEVLSNLKSGKVEVKVSDLGSARKIGERFSQYTPEYCPIEQVEAIVERKGADTSMDIYALGTTLFKLLTRRDYNPREVVETINAVAVMYSQKNDVREMIKKAKETYKKYYDELTVSDLEPGIFSLIKEMTNPDKRPSIEEVYNKLLALLDKYERSSNSG